MVNISIEPIRATNIEDDNIEIVERKGFGHPDTITNSLVEAISIEYYKNWKMHHNFDKASLFAGISEPEFGGGKIIKRATFCLGDRATSIIDGKKVDIHPTIERTINDWFYKNLDSFPVPEYKSFLAEGSGNLTDIFKRNTGNDFMPSNDTSASTGYAPFTPTEQVTLNLEKYLNSPEFKKEFPCSGKDIKIMTVRKNKNLDITIAMAMIDRHVNSVLNYKTLKDEIIEYARVFCKNNYPDFTPVISLNTLDKLNRGKDGLYLTVTGTSAESGDSGQVGRGNNPAGLISISRPVGVEAASGKNSISHVGRIYSYFCFHIADEIYQQLKGNGLHSVYVWMVSRIGSPINKPTIIYIKHDSAKNAKVGGQIEDIVTSKMQNINAFCEKLAKGEITV